MARVTQTALADGPSRAGVYKRPSQQTDIAASRTSGRRDRDPFGERLLTRSPSAKRLPLDIVRVAPGILAGPAYGRLPRGAADGPLPYGARLLLARASWRGGAEGGRVAARGA